MADRRKQPYLPLYVQDFLSDEKLRECSATSVGVYVFIMCLMHKSENYGMILLKQKDKQKSSQVLNFAYKLAKHLPYSIDIIQSALKELLVEGVLRIETDYLIQKRMVKDGETSEKRSRAGKIGGAKSLGKKPFIDASKVFLTPNSVQAKSQANTDIDNDNEIEIEIVSLEKSEKPLKIPTELEFLEYARSKCKDDHEFLLISDSCRLKYQAWRENDWRTGGDKPRKIKNWKTSLLNTIPHLKRDGGTPKSEGAMASLIKKHKL